MAYTAIDDPSLHFQVQLYTGNGSADHAITLDGDTDMQPDVVWIKNRDQADSHCLFNTLYGATVAKNIEGSSTASADADTLDAFQSDGFKVDADVKVNTNTEAYVAYCWKMGTTSGLAGSPSITMVDYSFNQTAGQSIVQWTGTDANGTVAHGLGALPHWSWIPFEGGSVYHHKNTSAPETDILYTNTTAATDDRINWWNDTAPTTDLTTVGNSSQVNGSGGDIVMYSFTSIQGYRKFGCYTGNGNADGAFAYTGFRPAFIIIKRSDGVDNWWLHDNKRGGYNGNNSVLYTNTNAAESASISVHLLSNGFKIRTTDVGYNASGGAYIFMAWAESPFVNSEGVPATAR